MASASGSDKLKQHMKKYKQLKDKRKIDYRESGFKPRRNLKSEILNASWDIDNRQFSLHKIDYIKEVIKEYEEEMKGETIETKELKEKIRCKYEFIC